MAAVMGPEARDLTPDEAQARVEEMFELNQQIKAGLRAGREAMWDVAASLHKFDEGNGWSALGYETQGEWLADIEIGMTRATFKRLVGSYRELVVRRQLPASRLADLDTSKVQIILPKLRTGSVKLEDALEDVKELGQRDLREKYMAPGEPDVEDGPDPDNDGDGLIDEPARDVPENDGEDTPTWASDVDEPDPDGGFDEDGEETQYEPAHNSPHVPSGQLPNIGGLKVAVHAAEVALRLPDRQAADRRAKREALANLVASVKTIEGWWDV